MEFSREYTKEEIQKFLIIYHHLTDVYSMEEKDIVPYVQKIGCIQFDPLDVVGRNPDLVLQARVVDYRKAYLEKLLYEDRLLFDAWDKNMSICTVEDWPHFTYFRQTFDDWCEKYKEAIREISTYLKEVDCACSSDFDMEERVRWHYGPQRLAKAALECMCYAGLAVVHHKVGTRRYYGLAEKYLPEHLIGQPNPYQNRAEYEKACVLRRIKGIGVLWNKAGDAWLGLSGLKQENRNRAFEALLEEGQIAGFRVQGMKLPLYTAVENMELLNKAAKLALQDDAVRLIAPLDNLLWDRRLIERVFGFAYRWEVYTPVDQRKYGYYVLPLLYQQEFIGRIELSVDKKDTILKVQNIWMEEGRNFCDYEEVIGRGLEKFARFCGCNGYCMKG